MAQQLDRLPCKYGGEEVLPAEPDDQRGEQRNKEAAVHQDVGNVGDGSGEEDKQNKQRACGDERALAACDRQRRLQLGKGDPRKEGAGVGERGVLEGPDPEAGGVSIGRPGQVVGVEVDVEHVRHEAHTPYRKQKRNEPPGSLRPGQANHPGKGEVERRLAGECPRDGVPEGGKHGAPALQQERGEDQPGQKLAVGACVPFRAKHQERERQGEHVNRVEPREAGPPEVALAECLPVRVVVGENVPRKQEEKSDKDVGVVDDGIEIVHVRRREVKEDDVQRQQRAHTGKRRQRRLAERHGRARDGRRAELGRSIGREQGFGHGFLFR